jgi:replicative DNA helicase
MANPIKIEDITPEEVVIRRIFEDSIVQNRVLPYLNQNLFDDEVNKSIVRIIKKYHSKYNMFPTAQTLVSTLPSSQERTQILKICKANLDDIHREASVDLITNFFKQKRVRHILTEAASSIYEGDFTNIESLVKDLEDSVKFNLFIDIGLDCVEDTPDALQRLNETLVAIPSGIDEIRGYTSSGTDKGGGWYRKCLSVFLGMPNVGKSILLCNEAAYAYQMGYNVLYVTMEMAEELIWERLAVNITNIPLNKIRGSDPAYVKELISSRTEEGASDCGNLFVKSLPSTTTVIEIESLLQEIKRTKGISIDLLVVDYLGIMKPAKRVNSYTDGNLYTMGKEVAEQLRDLARYHEIAVLTASQLNRDGYDNTNSSMKNTAGSAGLNDTADIMVTITSDTILKQNYLFLHTILKNRFGPNMVMFLSQCDYPHMRVRSASPEKVKQYSDSQANQTTIIEGFNGDSRPKAKRNEDVKRDKESKKVSNASNYSKPNVKQNILESKENQDIHQSPINVFS